ncbi:MAG: glucosyltransferase domain-containing protein [Lachnospiraceae bacterium]
MMRQIQSPAEVWEACKKNCKPIWKTAFLSAVLLGLLIHMPILVRDIPNHDGLDSMYFDQNMITSGRWFLTVACGISSYFTLPWLIGLLAFFYLGITAALLVEFLEIRNKGTAVLISGLLVAFPALASTFAYVFTLDGYMLALLLAVLAPLLTKKYERGFIAGGIVLAFSMGTYQSYLSFAMLLAIYGVVMLFLTEQDLKKKIKGLLHYLYMGVIGVALYYILLQVLLKLQGKVLASYQGINGMGEVAGRSLLAGIKGLYGDFVTFSVRSGVIFKNIFSTAAVVVLAILFLAVVIQLAKERKLYKSIWFYITMILLIVGLPVATNIILIISPEVNYHLLMRYQWVLYLICLFGFVDKYCEWNLGKWLSLLTAAVLVFNFAVIDNIAYSNLEKKYEKTYAYCLRLVDRMEQTEGYYPGIPVAMIGVVSDTQYPVTDITGEVTGSMIGMTGDYLLYTRTNYQAFLKHYLGVSINLVSDEEMLAIYDSPEYRAMGTFPEADSVKVVDGILYIKLENSEE